MKKRFFGVKQPDFATVAARLLDQDGWHLFCSSYSGFLCEAIAIAARNKLIKEREMDQVNNSETLTSGIQSSGFGSQTSGASTLETIKETVADKLHAAASTIQQKARQNQENAVAGYAGQAAGWLDDAAEYV